MAAAAVLCVIIIHTLVQGLGLRPQLQLILGTSSKNPSRQVQVQFSGKAVLRHFPLLGIYYVPLASHNKDSSCHPLVLIIIERKNCYHFYKRHWTSLILNFRGLGIIPEKLLDLVRLSVRPPLKRLINTYMTFKGSYL